MDKNNLTKIIDSASILAAMGIFSFEACGISSTLNLKEDVELNRALQWLKKACYRFQYDTEIRGISYVMKKPKSVAEVKALLEFCEKVFSNENTTREAYALKKHIDSDDVADREYALKRLNELGFTEEELELVYVHPEQVKEKIDNGLGKIIYTENMVPNPRSGDVGVSLSVWNSFKYIVKSNRKASSGSDADQKVILAKKALSLLREKTENQLRSHGIEINRNKNK